MSQFIAYIREFHLLTVLLRLTVAGLCGGFIGCERTKKRRAAGLRTYILASVGACLTVLLSMYEYKMLTGQWASIVEVVGFKFDASRYLAAVITGIGFLGAGTIMATEHQQVSGLSSATGLFATAIMGLSSGEGFYEAVIAMVIGLERSAKNRPAGFRTHILVCVAATSASLVGHYLYLCMQLPADVSRIGAQVVTGLGFIGAGTIIMTRKRTVKGLTTAAGLWATGIVGLAIGAGFYEGGIAATCVILLVQTVVSEMGRGIKVAPEFRIEVAYNQKAALDHVLRYSKDHNLAIRELQINNSEEDKNVYISSILARPGTSVENETLLEHFRTLKGVVDARILDKEAEKVPVSTH